LKKRTDIDKKVKKIIGKRYGECYNIFERCLRKIKTIIKKILRKFRTLLSLIKKAWVKYHFIIPPRVIKNFIKKLIKREPVVNNNILNPFDKNDYNEWLNCNSNFNVIKELEYNPLISFVIPVYNVKRSLLMECLDSILNQSYKNIEICLADDCSTHEDTIKTLKQYEKKYDNVKVVYREKNGHISAASNSALELVNGEYVAMMDNDDVIPSNAIYEMVKALNDDKTIDMIYSDEDKLNVQGQRCDPHFKSDYAPDTLLSVNYFCHFTLLRTSILKKIGGWKVGYEGAQDWDLFLKFVEQAKNIYHLPKILYQWRMLEGSTSMGLSNKKYAMDTAKKSIEDALERRKTPGIVRLHDKVPYYWIEYTYKKEPMISIIIPTKDYASTLDKCLKSIYKKTTYKNYEIIVVDNNSKEKETFKLFDDYSKEHKNFKVIKADMEFNFSKINNLAVGEAKGEYILLLNNDTEVITDNWLQLMVGYAMQSHIGAVGAKLIYPDKTIQHGGVIMGMGGVAGHVFVNSPMNYEGIYGRLCVPYNYSVVTAACLMVKKDKYNEVNGLTEELKVAYNDVDFCLKLVEQGYHNIMVPMVELFHYESKSRGQEDTKEKQARFKSESDYMYEHWKKYIDNDPMYNINLSRNAVFMLEKDTNE
jgi:GT2 family glycosyltransferase